jgi:hypothetical protein
LKNFKNISSINKRALLFKHTVKIQEANKTPLSAHEFYKRSSNIQDLIAETGVDWFTSPISNTS